MVSFLVDAMMCFSLLNLGLTVMYEGYLSPTLVLHHLSPMTVSMLTAGFEKMVSFKVTVSVLTASVTV